MNATIAPAPPVDFFLLLSAGNPDPLFGLTMMIDIKVITV